MASGSERCGWVSESTDELMLEYHDVEWGTPAHDDVHLFEMLTLEGAQAGLSWATILHKREGYRAAFAGFDALQVAGFNDWKIERLMSNPGIVRNRLKIESTVENAKAVLGVTEKHGSLDAFIWGLVGGQTRVNTWQRIGEIPSETAESHVMSVEMRRRGFRFVGPTVCYAFMQAVGMVNDHMTGCFRHDQLDPSQLS
jgi:DNA-3-methyladenine glycosylase I